ncbi:MAG: ComEA family DNA-binding protein, partial [Longimicrobiales bacterium]
PRGPVGPPPRDRGQKRLDLNRAGLEELQGLPGIGPALAARILESRSREGPFGTAEDLLRVPGIGPAKLALLRPLVRVAR